MLQAFNFFEFNVHCSFLLFHIVFFPSYCYKGLISSSFLLSFFPSFPHVVRGLLLCVSCFIISTYCCLLFPFHFTFHFGLLLPIPSLVLHLVVVCYLFHDWLYIIVGATCLLLPSCLALLLLVPSFMFSPIVAYSILFHTWPYCCTFPPLHFALLLHVPSLMFGPNATCSLFHVSPYYCMFLPSCFALLVPTPSFMFDPIVASSLLCASPCYYMFPPLSFALLLAYSFTPHLIIST